VALAVLVERLTAWDCHFLDAQFTSEHMISLGARDIPRRVFLKRLRAALREPTHRGKWRVKEAV
jgi:leucyl/phenylalanyl-tRNA--protein transferase